MPLNVNCLSTADVIDCTMSCAYEKGGFVSSLGPVESAVAMPTGAGKISRSPVDCAAVMSKLLNRKHTIILRKMCECQKY